MARRLPQLSGRSLALVVNALLALVALGLAFAPAGEGAPQLRLASAGGALSLSNSKEGAAIFQAEGMRPGQQASGTVTITNTGSVNAALTLQPEAAAETAGHGGGKLSNTLELLVVDVTLAAPVTVYEGTLKAMGATNVGSLEPGASRTYLFVASLRPQGASDNAYQGAEFSTGFRWNASGAGSPTVSPTPTATPSPTATEEPQTPAPAPDAPPATGSGATPPPPPGPAADPVADPTGELLGAQLFALPAATRKCVSRRKFAIHVRRPEGMTFSSIAVTVNGRTKVRLTGSKARKVKATVSLKGLPAGKVTVTITAVMSSGRKAVSKRTYTTCAAKKPSLKRKR
jgi:spore coat-associated protein N